LSTKYQSSKNLRKKQQKLPYKIKIKQSDSLVKFMQINPDTHTTYTPFVPVSCCALYLFSFSFDFLSSLAHTWSQEWAPGWDSPVFSALVKKGGPPLFPAKMAAAALFKFFFFYLHAPK
jgi:hypothetical protein